ncbi:MAG: hypothetical protein ACKPKO_50655, partial [Candidatus Fonsibacter sp.]
MGSKSLAIDKLALKKCEDLYAGVIQNVRMRHQLEKPSVEDKDRVKRKKEEALKKLDPKAALKGLVDEAVAAAVGDVSMNHNVSDVDHASALIKALQPKKGYPRGWLRGHPMAKVGNRSKRQRARAKAKDRKKKRE